MKQSISYYLTLFIIRLKGIKKNFSEDPIDVFKVRKEDQHKPKGQFFKRNRLRSIEIADSVVTEVGLNKTSNQLVISIHGGAFISGPTQLHWDAVKKIATQTAQKVWLCDYPKAPENQIGTISENIYLIYQKALEEFEPHNISMIGDSVGGTLVVSLMQCLIKQTIKLPKQIILISPVMDASMTNSEIEAVEFRDPMLARKGVLSAKKLCAGKLELKDTLISPLYGEFDRFPLTTIYAAENDITYPDQKLTIEKLKESEVEVKVITGENMPHIWPLLPVMKEAELSFQLIVESLKNKVTSHQKE
ncbi:alpha/beta hydrolase fold domain-containing protein [Sediminitomix flava]|uniref:Acetyl esterase/lipase n=1 Tax=Sediminitomix flava TaxID=379075 RepID=A0A315ZDA9_SEDFL|nr:alpha/beta hydrolase fold domain-containing protein [Sediminitomix flava]PWJ43103.1 acetyl esterase/lipase [Sediminitomix flava]